MLPPFAGYKYFDLLPSKLPEPLQVEYTFIGGSLDGTKHTATVKGKLDGYIMRVTIGKEVYKLTENNTFTYEGERGNNANEKES